MPFITCSRKKSMPRVSISLCEQCRKQKKCQDYALFREPVLFDGFKKGSSTVKRKPARVYKEEKEKTINNEKQLILSFLR